jgi:aspartyl protease family protein
VNSGVNLPVKLAIASAIVMAAVGTMLPRRLMPEATATITDMSARPGASTRAALPASTGERSVTLQADGFGHFQAGVEIEGRIISMMVDTGATEVALTADDAATIGLHPLDADYTARISTANGVTAGAPVQLRDVRIGAIVAHDVNAIVMPAGALRQSLLGMSFLAALGHLEMGDRRLVLRQ